MRLQQVVDEAVKKGFGQKELEGVIESYRRAQGRYEERNPRAAPGLDGAIQYIEDCTRICYAAATLHIDRTIDRWHEQGDGKK
jgi:DNA integrity scanning protein DisA with diadenylate cyclase activity